MTVIRKPAGRSLADFQTLDQPLKPAEQKLLEACRLGKIADISAERPEAATDDNTVRAAFLRFLALGGDEQAPVHEHGVQLVGAWIEGNLDMEAARVPSDLTIAFCHFDVTPVFRGAKIAGTLNLSGCQIHGFAGDRLACDGDLLLRHVFVTTGEVRLIGAKIGGSFACSGAKLEGKDGYALSADGAVINGGVFLNKGFIATEEVRLAHVQIGGNLECHGAKFDGKDGDALSADGVVIKGGVFLNEGCTATGEVRLLHAQISGNLECGSAKFDGKGGNALSVDGTVIKGNVFLNEGFTATGEVRLPNAKIGGNLSCGGAKFDSKRGDALFADGILVEGTFFFRKLASTINGVSLSSSYVGCLADDKDTWGERLVLDGFVYGSITGGAPIDAVTRLAWLDRQSQTHAGIHGDGADFRPQPWRQLAKVLQKMGHAEDARQVAIAFEHRLREANLIKHPFMHWLFWVFTGYGYRPLRLLGWMFGVWLICAMFYWYAAAGQGVFAPSNPLVFQNPNYAVCAPGYVVPAPQAANAAPPTVQGAGNWYLCEKLPEEYSGFSPLAYSLDVILPLVDLQQETSWSPLVPTPKAVWYQELFSFCDWKHFTRLVLWFEILFGWVSSLLLVAVVSGLTKRREE